LEGLVGILTSWSPLLAGLAWLGFFKGNLGIVGTVGLLSGIVLVLVIRALVWPALRFRAFRYHLREGDLLVEHGVLWRQRVCVPRDRVQHVDTHQGPLERFVGLSRLLVYTAAGLSADGSLPGLDEAEADRLRDLLARRGQGDDGV
jgi:membrane protein YdbS with pleckstrin-like domain